MNLLPTDTSQEAQNVQYRCWSKITPAERYQRMSSFSKQLIETSRNHINQTWPNLSKTELFNKYVASQYGEELAEKVAKYVERLR